ncbi:hypothetical protein WJX73_003979 [Symbiochloris irregularis]|uniref:histidinol-phosphatase n=1 Tax=Symbiochloris irregularis TaxID=706552 RepID=A0AAW1P3G1_9CHLO
MVPANLIDLAQDLAEASADVIRPYFRSKLSVDQKADASPVTQADRAAELAMRKIILERCPHHDVLGEEFGLQRGETPDRKEDQGYRWVLDPIDGTKAFITGKPSFGTLIALLHKGVPVLGIINQPITRERWLGVAGQPSTLNGQQISCRPCEDLSKAYLFATSPHMFPAGPVEDGFSRVRDQVFMPLYGCDCYAYGLLSLGLADLVIEATMQPYDYLALVPVIEGAGGVISDWQGKPLHWPISSVGEYSSMQMPGECIAAGDEVIHQKALALLKHECKASPLDTDPFCPRVLPRSSQAADLL